MSTDLKELIASVVYQREDGLSPVQIVESLAQLGIQASARQVLEIVSKNPKLFIEAGGKICGPSYVGRKSEHMDMKDMIATVLCQTSDGLVPLQLVEELGSQFGLQTSTKQVLQAVSRHPKLFAEVEGRIINRYDNSL
jgi:hypothetical protein